MKKAIGLAVLLLIGVRAQAATDQKTLDLLKKINGEYYCLSRMGLKKFKCEMTFSFLENVKTTLVQKYGADDKRVKALQGLKFFMDFQGVGKWDIETNYNPTGDKDIDDAVNQLISAAKEIADRFMKVIFNSVVVDTEFSEKQMADTDYKVVNKAEGFQVVSTHKDMTMTIDFDAADHGTDLKYLKAGQLLVSMEYGYLSDPKGILANAVKIEATGAKIIKYFDVVYQPVSGFQLPATLDYKEHPTEEGAKDFEATVTFKGYKVN
jgi:hypothetical protein